MENEIIFCRNCILRRNTHNFISNPFYKHKRRLNMNVFSRQMESKMVARNRRGGLLSIAIAAQKNLKGSP